MAMKWPDSRWLPRTVPRTLLLAIGLAGLGIVLVAAFTDLPEFGTTVHRYGARAVDAAVRRRATGSAVASVNFDQRAFDTMGEEFLIFAGILGAAVVLRTRADESHERIAEVSPLVAVRAAGYLALPVTLLFGAYVVVHGHLSPGGGFQGGIVLATGVHLAYLTGSYPALERIRPFQPFERAEASSAVAYVLVGLIGVVGVGAFLANALPHGSPGSLLSAGTVPVLQIVVGAEVGAGFVVLVTEFLRQAVEIREPAR